ncbi:oxysterol-binding protein homolog 1 [Trichomonascus vanleenenianus]|uniref:oxysterol-binding protein homolog 1 n=1 Tax=Trichomonascus vanleenenianus TaxID=2268995 RepID=UPI003ECB7B84
MNDSEDKLPLTTDEANSISDSLESSILRLRIISALKGENYDDLREIIQSNTSKRDLLHLAVQIAPLSVIQWLVESYGIDINGHVPHNAVPVDKALDVNGVDENGNTPLHLAASFGRNDVALYLLSLPQINDSVTNSDGKQPVELSKYPETAEAMQIARARYVERIATQLKQYLMDENIPALEDLLSHPRASTLLDINGQDPDTGSTVLHDFVRRKNYKMVEFILSHGGDPFRRDVKGVLPIEVCRDDAIKKLLKTATKKQPVINPPSSSGVARKKSIISGGASGGNGSQQPTLGEPPSIKGYLKKWTNFTGGYKLRWFVLEDGVLSYYKRQDDTDRACRGSINMRKAVLHLDSSEKLRFEITTPGSSTKFHLKANHPVETNRWVWALTNAIQYAKDKERLRQHGSTSSSAAALNRISSHASKKSVSDAAQFASRKVTRSLSGNSNLAPPRTGSGSISDEYSTGNDSTSAIVVLESHASLTDNDMAKVDESEDEYGVSDDEDEAEEVPLRSEQGVLEDTVKVEVRAIKDLLVTMRKQARGEMEVGLNAFAKSIETVEQAMLEYTKQAETREAMYVRKLEHSENQQRLWAQNIRELEIEHERIQGQLHKAIQKKKEAAKLLREATSYRNISPAGYAGAAEAFDVAKIDKVIEEVKAGIEDEEESDDEFFDIENEEQPEEKPQEEEKRPVVAKGLTPVPTTAHVEPEEARETEKVPKEEKETEEMSGLTTEAQMAKKELIETQKSFLGYEDPPRKRLKMDVDDRPKISLWGILKNLIGKDMTRMTLPVSFNECTNLLQRSAEDMEYTDLLDKASQIVDDASLRLAYVAAFAASSYSSTINRIAKPFNPLLGETFEYSRPDKGYRLFAEQVSHHPPIGAMMAEHPKWDFYGESNVKSKFNGRSFDINPLGRWYVVVRPDHGCEVQEELYSFRKLTSSVVGIITGSPVVDNYGDMEIVNHTLGNKALIKFKSRGWRGANAYELKGTVYSPEGTAEWIVGGKWNNKIMARQVTHGGGADTPGTPPNELDDSLTSTKPIVLWQVHDRPPAPFNLTPFAITLNALPDRLKPHLAPTDTRLRPDQRAMEEGRYDDASDDKHRVEEKQRAARRRREANGEEYQPVWFSLEKHPITGDPFYRPHGTYWKTRLEGKLPEVSHDIF